MVICPRFDIRRKKTKQYLPLLGLELDSRGLRNETALHVAARARAHEALALLLKLGAQPNVKVQGVLVSLPIL